MTIDVTREEKRVLKYIKQSQFYGLPAMLTLDQWLERINQFNGLCAYCLEMPFEALDHLIPTTAGGGTIYENCVPSCGMCNSRKNGRILCDTGDNVSFDARLEQAKQALKDSIHIPRVDRIDSLSEKNEGETITFHLPKQEAEFLQRYLVDHGEEPGKWRKAARRYAKEGIYSRIKTYLDAIII